MADNAYPGLTFCFSFDTPESHMIKPISAKMKRTTKPATITCPRCDGSGTIELDGQFAAYVETLKMLQRQKKELNGVDLAALARIKPTAMNNRLVWLEEHGLAVGRWQGRGRLWKAAQ